MFQLLIQEQNATIVVAVVVFHLSLLFWCPRLYYKYKPQVAFCIMSFSMAMALRLPRLSAAWWANICQVFAQCMTLLSS